MTKSSVIARDHILVIELFLGLAIPKQSFIRYGIASSCLLAMTEPDIFCQEKVTNPADSLADLSSKE